MRMGLVNGTRIKLGAANAERASLRIAANDDGPLAAGAVEMRPGAFHVSYEHAGQGFRLSWKSETADLRLGTLTAEATPDGVRLGWNAGRLEEARLTADRMREAVLSAGLDHLPLKIAAGDALLPGTGHYVVVLDSEPLQVLAGGQRRAHRPAARNSRSARHSRCRAVPLPPGNGRRPAGGSR